MTKVKLLFFLTHEDKQWHDLHFLYSVVSYFDFQFYREPFTMYMSLLKNVIFKFYKICYLLQHSILLE